jgi:hypothetical protein
MASVKASGLEMLDTELQVMERDVTSPDVKSGTVIDDHDMQRMGKAQELKVCQFHCIDLSSNSNRETCAL